MSSLQMDGLLTLDKLLKGSTPPPTAIAVSIGGSTLADGIWRFFSPTLPAGGVDKWNKEWRTAWGIQSQTLFSFGEDVFGNQLVLTAAAANVHIFDHEDGSCADLGMNITDVLRGGLDHGLDWIDFYQNGSLQIAKEFVETLSWEQHLHWLTPLIIGGTIARENLRIVERLAHLRGHVNLWRQIANLPPGTEVQIKL